MYWFPLIVSYDLNTFSIIKVDGFYTNLAVKNLFEFLLRFAGVKVSNFLCSVRRCYGVLPPLLSNINIFLAIN